MRNPAPRTLSAATLDRNPEAATKVLAAITTAAPVHPATSATVPHATANRPATAARNVTGEVRSEPRGHEPGGAIRPGWPGGAIPPRIAAVRRHENRSTTTRVETVAPNEAPSTSSRTMVEP